MARKELSLKQRYEILKRDHFMCLYCGRRPPEVELAVDHVRSVAHGGTNHPCNLITACVPCNAGKKADSVSCCTSCVRPLCRGRANPRDDLEAGCTCQCHLCATCGWLDCVNMGGPTACIGSIAEEEMLHDVSAEEGFSF